MGEWLQSLLPWGTEAIVWVQSFIPPWLEALFQFFTFLGCLTDKSLSQAYHRGKVGD